ncbi:unnamed protein product [Miscanthus lutarioriparius]|uniref:Uncharacterized protein n=1 Tax=Miscanthus lutarioriparius TaxID=422564 RepID=A0A811NVJ4_9POAL|nr:unnamed protein product [Miscanthus lutarioriparius]
MGRDDGGALVPAPAPAPTPGQVYLPAWRRAYDRLVKMLRQAYAQAEELSVEREHLITELQFLQSGIREREEISQARLQQICKHEELRKRVVEAETAARIGGKELQIHCYKKLAELAEDDLEDFKSCISNLAAENTELKEKLKKFESQVEICTDNSDHQKSGKDIREEIRKLKKAYMILRSEKDKEISALQAEKNFVCNQLKTMEEDYSGAIKSKSIEVKQAQKLLQNVDELQVAAQKKDDEIVRLQVEVTNAKERMSILEDELQKMRSLVKDKDLETDKNEDDQSDTSKMSKKDINKANRKSKSTRTSQVTPDISRTSQVTPDRREVKTTQHMRLRLIRNASLAPSSPPCRVGFTLVKAWNLLKKVHRRAQPIDGFAKALLALDKRLHGSADSAMTMEIQKLIESLWISRGGSLSPSQKLTKVFHQ